MRRGEYKLIQDLEDGAYELYNLDLDKQEHNNLDQLEPGIVEELSGLLNEWRKGVDAKPLRKSAATGEEPPVLG